MQIAPSVRRIVAGNAGMMTGPGTNTYLLGTRDVAVLDPGPSDAGHLDAILAAAGSAIRWIIATHTHADHSPLVVELAERTGASVIGLAPPSDGRQDLTFSADHAPHDGERMILGELRLTAVLTPGHASNCVCYLLEEERLLFTGDHVLEGVAMQTAEEFLVIPRDPWEIFLKGVEELSSDFMATGREQPEVETRKW